MNKLIEKIEKRISKISELIRPVGWSKKIEVVETKAVLDIIHEEAKTYNEVKTNADYIHNMSVEELATIIMCPYENTPGNCVCEEDDTIKNCIQCCADWLKAEREG